MSALAYMPALANQPKSGQFAGRIATTLERIHKTCDLHVLFFGTFTLNTHQARESTSFSHPFLSNRLDMEDCFLKAVAVLIFLKSLQHNFQPRLLSGRFRHNASLAIPHRKSFAAIPSVSWCSLGTRIVAFRCHTNRSVQLPLFRYVQA